MSLVEDLHRRAGSKRFWEEEQERIDLGTCCLILSCSLWDVRPTYRMSQWNLWNHVLFRCGTTCCLLYQRASLRYQQGCTACFTDKQPDLSILMPL